jgi:hypothetical protein
MGDEQRINYGVIFQKHLNIDFATDYWNHVYEIPIVVKSCKPYFSYLKNKKKIKKRWELFCASDLK